MKFRLNIEYVTFNVCQIIKQPKDMCVVSMIDKVNKYALVALIEKSLRIEALVSVIMNFEGGHIDGYDKLVSTFDSRGS